MTGLHSYSGKQKCSNRRISRIHDFVLQNFIFLTLGLKNCYLNVHTSVYTKRNFKAIDSKLYS